MKTAQLRSRLEQVLADLKLAEEQLETGLKKLTAPDGEKEIIAESLESAFARIREAKREIVELTAALAKS